jgi:general secretion pathway protein D
MQVKKFFLCLALAIPLIASAQFDFGGGQSGPPWKGFKLNPKTRIQLDFKNANPDMIINLMSKTSGVTIVKDPSLKTPLTIASAKPVSLEDAFQIFQSVLDLAGYDLQKSGSILVIRKKPEGGARGGLPAGIDMSAFAGGGGGGGNSNVLKVYPIKYANATELARVINDVYAPAAAAGATAGGGGFGGGRGRFGGGQTITVQTPDLAALAGGAGGGGGGRNRTPPNVKASADDYSNSVIVNAPDQQQTEVEDLINKLDKQTDTPQQTRVYKLVYASAQDIAQAVQNVLVSNAPQGRGGATTSAVPIEQRFQQAIRLGGTQASFGTVAVDVRTNSLVVTATPDNLKIVESVLQTLDQPVDYQNSVIVIPLENARADLTAQVLNQAFGSRTNTNTNTLNNGSRGPISTNNARAGGGNNGRPTTGPSDPNSMPVNLQDPSAQSGPLATTVDVAQGFQIFGGGGGRGGGFGGQNGQNGQQGVSRNAQGQVVNTQNLYGNVTVIADPTTNSLIIVASPDAAEMVRKVVDQIDKIPQQVMIETLIVEASLDATDKLGVEWNFTQAHAFGNSNATGSGASNFNDPRSAGGNGFTYALTGRDFSVFLDALKTDQKFQILSAPRIFTSNNTQAQINVSQQVPYVLSQQTDTNGNIIFNYAFQDVGIVLTVTPRISANGTVTMDVTQTANDLQGFTSFNAPIVNQREADTTVSVQDGQTIVLGGIMRTTVSSTVNKVPLLGDIPILGNLFKSTSKDKNKTELLVFLTPHIVKNPDDAQTLRKNTTEKLSPETKKAVDGALGQGGNKGGK